MAEEEVQATASLTESSPVLSDHKRKLEETQTKPKLDKAENEEDGIANGGSDPVADAEADAEEEADGSEAKRPRLDGNVADGLVSENGSQEASVGELKEEDSEQPVPDGMNIQSEVTKETASEATLSEATEQKPVAGDQQIDESVNPSNGSENLPTESTEEQEPSKGENQDPLSNVSLNKDVSSIEETFSEAQTMSRKIEVPNNKVGVLIGKAGDTIRYLQINSGARIQIMRDDEADLSSSTRPVELIGNAESINKAEKLIKDVIAEAEAGGSPSLVARGISTVQAAGTGEQILIQVPNEKVGLIIGKGGETIKSLQTRSGARIQLIPQHAPEGDQSKERIVRVTGDKKQIEMAREMIKEVMNQSGRPSTPGGYSQQAFRPRGPAASQWGPRGPHFQPPSGYEYQQQGQYPSQNIQYPGSAYGNYPHQQMPPRSGFGPGWETRPSPTMQGPPQGGGYGYYGGHGGRVDAQTSTGLSNAIHSHGPGPAGTNMGPPPSQANYNYGHPHSEYGTPAPYGHQSVPAQGYGQGYNEAKYEHQTPMQHQYGGHGAQASLYPQGGMHPGYGSQDQYGKPPPSYGMAPQGTQVQAYGQPRASQPGEVSYQGINPSTQQPYGSGVPGQQPYPYTLSMPMQQVYPQYGSAPPADVYSNPQPATASAPVYSQQSGQPAAGYGQPVAQQAPAYGQVAPAAAYGTYSAPQASYSEQPAANANYGYQGAADPAAYGSGQATAYSAPPSGQPNYAQPAPTQPGYDQSAAPAAGYGPGSAPAGYGKSVSPQPAGYAPPYDSSQMYGTHN